MDMNPKYIVKDQIGEFVVTRADIAKKIENPTSCLKKNSKKSYFRLDIAA